MLKLLRLIDCSGDTTHSDDGDGGVETSGESQE